MGHYATAGRADTAQHDLSTHLCFFIITGGGGGDGTLNGGGDNISSEKDDGIWVAKRMVNPNLGPAAL